MVDVNRLVTKLAPLVPPVLLGAFIKRSMPNLAGDRDIEWSWVSAHIPDGPGKALDFGPGTSFLGLIATLRGFDVTAIDIEQVHWHYDLQNLHFVKGDILKIPLPAKHFDLIINCSTIEHVGLAGRYGVTDDREDGDLEAMVRLTELIKPGGTMLLTVPAGQDAVYSPWHRVYGKERLPRLLEGYQIEKEVFWIKDEFNKWKKVERDVALSFKSEAGSWNPLKNIYALACFVLKW